MGRQHQGFGKSLKAVENKEKWRKLVGKSSVVPQWPSQLKDRWWWWWWWWCTKHMHVCVCVCVMTEKNSLWPVLTQADIYSLSCLCIMLENVELMGLNMVTAKYRFSIHCMQSWKCVGCTFSKKPPMHPPSITATIFSCLHLQLLKQLIQQCTNLSPCMLNPLSHAKLCVDHTHTIHSQKHINKL